MDLSCEINEVFGIPLCCIKVYSEDEALCLVHNTWLVFLRNGLQIPAELQKNVADENLLNFYFTSSDIEQNSPWKLITLYSWNKTEGKVHRFPKPHEKSLSVAVHLSYSQLIHYVTKTNYKNLWEQAWRKYHTSDSPKRNKQKQDYADALRDVLKRLYKTQTSKRQDGVYVYTTNHEQAVQDFLEEKEDAIHPNLMQMLCAVENSQFFFLLCGKNVCTLRDCLMFSPFVMSGSTIRPLFVVYQLLQALRSVHNSGLFMGPIALSNIHVNENLWVQTVPLAWRALYNEAHKSGSEKQIIVTNDHTSNDARTLNNVLSKISGEPSSLIYKSHAPKRDVENFKDLPLSALVQGWIDGSISNYDYLIALNELAGREKDNPRCHYVMPWIMDFSVPDGGWRDLSKSKFRLNKGDKQLDLIYELATESTGSNASYNSASILQDTAVMVPHHTSEVLADITYYVYKARRMPKSFLCQHVRQKWVPAEYPSTIERLQEWTPDECIPEFFSDPSIFYSIHPDLSDLGVPWWCDGPEDFIKRHKEALESCHVTERLHHWIDLVFGYKLTGTSAIKAKNVCLPLVDDHTSVQNYGMVQLFSHPHPHKLSKSIFSRCFAPKTFRSIILKVPDAKDSGDDDTSSESIGKTGFLKGLRSKPLTVSSDLSRPEPRPEKQTIVLPKDLNPLAALSHFESLFTFLSWAGGGKMEKNNNYEIPKVNDILTYHYQVRDLFVLGCLISEIAIMSHCKTLPQNVTLDERYVNVVKLLRIHKQEIPRCLQKVIQLLLQVSPSYQENQKGLPTRYPPVSPSGLPLPSPHQLLIPAIRIIPFSPFFPKLYSFLLKLNKFSSEIISISEDHESDFPEKQRQRTVVTEKKVCFAAEQLQSLLPLLNSEGIELLIPYLKEMFENQHTALLATWHLFGIVSRALGPQQTCQKLLPQLIRVFNTDKPSPKHLKLYHRTFLLQLIVGLGLHNFLTHFTTPLIEAIGGCKDYSPKTSESESLYMQKAFGVSKLDNVSEDADDAFPDDVVYEVSYRREINSSQEALHLQPEMSNEEDNEIFDLDVNEEVLQENEDVEDIQAQKYFVKDKDKSNVEIDPQNSSSYYIPVEPETDKLVDALTTDSLNTIYSQSAPNLTCHLSEYSTLSSCDGDKNATSPERERTETDTSGSENMFSCSPGENEFGLDFNVSDVSAESMLWLAHRLGPVLTARYLTRNLLRMLTLCYDGPEKREIVYLPPGNKESGMLSISCKWLKGDINAFKVLHCLSRIASLYGEQFIMLQYIKHIADLLNLCRKKVPATLESGLHGAMALLHHVIPYISDATLMDHLQDIIIKDILLLVLRLISSLRLIYPGGGKSRTMITLRMLDVIYTIGLRIGFEMTRMHLSNVLQKFFSCFEKIYDEKGECREREEILGSSITSTSATKEQALMEMRETFTPEMAFVTYIPFCKLAGGIHMEKTLKNDELIRALCLQHEKNTAIATSKQESTNEKSHASASFQMTHHRDHSLGQDESFVSGVFGKNVSVVGNRLDVQLGDESYLVMGIGDPVPSLNTEHSSTSFSVPHIPKYDINLIKRKMDNCQRHLKGNWLAYWEHETGRSEKESVCHFDFKQIKLQTFIGHSGTVRTVQVLDNENSFLTSSKDKTVKLWSLRSCGDGSSQIPCQLTYTQHRKSVFAVSFLESLRLVGSCDSTVHIWDPFLGSCIRQLEPTKGSPITVLTAMPAPSMTFLAATTNSSIKFLDARTCKYMHEFKVSVGTTGLIRCLAVSPNGYWLAVGHSTGMLSVLDVRTGLLFGTWPGHEGEILQLKAFNNSTFVTSSLDHSLTVWKFEDTQAKCNLKGPMEPVTSLCFYGNEVISGTTGNRIGLHSSVDKKATYTSTRLRSDTVKGMLTTIALLPLNRLLLLGTDNGSVVLLC